MASPDGALLPRSAVWGRQETKPDDGSHTSRMLEYMSDQFLQKVHHALNVERASQDRWAADVKQSVKECQTTMQSAMEKLSFLTAFSIGLEQHMRDLDEKLTSTARDTSDLKDHVNELTQKNRSAQSLPMTSNGHRGDIPSKGHHGDIDVHALDAVAWSDTHDAGLKTNLSSEQVFSMFGLDVKDVAVEESSMGGSEPESPEMVIQDTSAQTAGSDAGQKETSSFRSETLRVLSKEASSMNVVTKAEAGIDKLEEEMWALAGAGASLIDQPEMASLHLAQSGKHSPWQMKSLRERVFRTSFWHNVFAFFKILHRFPHKPVDGIFSKVVFSTYFSAMCIFVTVCNAAWMGYEADATMRSMLADPPSDPHSTFVLVDMGFLVFFSSELLLRVFAGRIWFFVCPGANLNFFRLLRVLRLARVAKVICALHFFRPLRRMMLSIVASMSSLFWACVFLLLIMFMFTIFFLNGATEHIKATGYEDSVRADFREFYPTLADTMFSLIIAISGGKEWTMVMEPLAQISMTYQLVFTFYILFVVFGVLNVLVGVFMESSAEFDDRDLIVQGELDRLDSFVEQMMGLFNDFHPGHDGTVDWEQFQAVMMEEHIEAYLSAHMLETTHARMLFGMLDTEGDGVINIYEFVLGLLRLKGVAKTYDNRIILHEIGSLRKYVQKMHEETTGVKEEKIKKVVNKRGQYK